MIFKLLANKLFDDCHVEAYSYWVKKRVLVFEYGINGKIKLGIESLDEQGALIDFTVGQCLFKAQCNVSLDALIIYFRKTIRQPVAVLIYAKKDLEDLNLERFKNDIECIKQLSLNLTIKLIVATQMPKDWVINSMKDLGYELFVDEYDKYIGREVEEFIKN